MVLISSCSLEIEVKVLSLCVFFLLLCTGIQPSAWGMTVGITLSGLASFLHPRLVKIVETLLLAGTNCT